MHCDLFTTILLYLIKRILLNIDSSSVPAHIAMTGFTCIGDNPIRQNIQVVLSLILNN